MDAASLREKAALCLRISRGLSWNNPGRFQLTDLAERLERQAKEIDLQNREKEADTSKSVPLNVRLDVRFGDISCKGVSAFAKLNASCQLKPTLLQLEKVLTKRRAVR